MPYPAAPYGFYPPPPKRPPKKIWFGVGAVLLALGLAVGLIAGVGGLGRINAKEPQPETTFANRGATTVHLEPGTRKVLFVAGPDSVGGHQVHCVAAGGGSGRVSLKRYDGTLKLHQWNAIFTLEATEAADYQLSCMGAPTDTFGVGGYVGPGAFFAGIIGVLAGLGLVLAGIVTMIVTAVLRRNRLQAAGQHY